MKLCRTCENRYGYSCIKTLLACDPKCEQCEDYIEYDIVQELESMVREEEIHIKRLKRNIKLLKCEIEFEKAEKEAKNKTD